MIPGILKQPLEYKYNRWKIILIVSLVVFFLLASFQPFGLDRVTPGERWLRIVGFTLVTASSTAVVAYLFPLVFTGFYNPEKWTWGKFLLNALFVQLFISLGNFAFDWSISDRPPGTFYAVLFSYVSITFLVGLLPMILLIMFTQNYVLKQNLKDAGKLNLHIRNKEGIKTPQPPAGTDTINGPFTLSGSTKEKITLLPQDFLYAEASGNYVKVYYLAGGNTVKSTLLRTTIIQVESLLENYPQIHRCHRAFIVNTFHVINVEGNSQGFNLSLEQTKDVVPVSRSYTKKIREALGENG